jgi:DNA transposition AAA+ family ATPase
MTMAEAIRLAKTGAPPAFRLGDFIETDISQEILRSLHLVDRHCGMTMICGVPGVGKTMTLRSFAEAEPLARLVKVAAPAEGTTAGFADLLGEEFGVVVNGRRFGAVRRMLGETISEAATMLMVDEGQHLDGPALEWARAICEEWNIGLVLAGDTDLHRNVAVMPQLHSRMLRPVLIRHVGMADVATLAATVGLSNRVALGAIHTAARRRGGLRTVEAVLRLCRIYAGAGPITVEHVRAALAEMKLDGGGV